MCPVIELVRPRRIHLVGIGGAGMSAIATVLAAAGHEVSGSDLRDSIALERLRASGVRVFVGHRPEQVGIAEIVARSTAVPDANVEVIEARRRGIPVATRAELLAGVVNTVGSVVAVAGTHGKTTTASMSALVAVEAGLRPSFIIGGDLNEIGSNAVWGDGRWCIVEADESDGTFLELPAELAVVTSVEPDHLEHYGSFAALEDAFRRFARAAPLGCVVSADDPVALELVGSDRLSFGFSPASHFRITDFASARSELSFELSEGERSLGRFNLPVPGVHNARNAAAAVVIALELGASLEDARHALARFGGVARRFEFRGQRDGVTFVDDYAHLPGEVVPTIAAARAGGFRRVICVFQPHRYSRTATLWQSFADAFVDADVVLVTEVYAAGEAPRPGVSAALIADAVRAAHPDALVEYVPAREQLVSRVKELLAPGDCCLTLGAGDLTTLADELVDLA